MEHSLNYIPNNVYKNVKISIGSKQQQNQITKHLAKCFSN